MNLRLSAMVLVLGSLVGCVQSSLPHSGGQNEGSNRRSEPQYSPVPPAPSSSSSPQYTPPQQIEPEPLSSTCLGPDSSPAVCEAERLIVVHTNEYRTSAKTLFGSPRAVPPLTQDARLSAVARRWSREQAAVGAISHDGFLEGNRQQIFAQLFPNQVLKFVNPRENVAMFSYRYSPAETARQFADMWYKSWGHRVNMLAGNVTKIGVGVYRDPRNGSTYATQIFIQ